VQSEKVLIMPIPTSGRPPQLRREENPPYPGYDIEILREVLKINETVGQTAHAVNALESELKNHGEKLGRIAEMAHAIRTLENESKKHGDMLNKIDGHIHNLTEFCGS